MVNSAQRRWILRGGCRRRRPCGAGASVLGLVALVAGAVVGARSACASEQGYRTSSSAHALGRILTAERVTTGFSLHMRPTTALAEAAVARLEGTLLEVRTRLGLPQAGKVEAFVYASSDELADLTGKSGWAVFADGALHLAAGALSAQAPPDARARLVAALAEALEADWARDGGVLGPPEPGHWYRARLVAAGGQLTLSLDGKVVAKADCPARPGRVGIAVGRGSLSVRKVRLREGKEAAWAEPLRGAGRFETDVSGAWRQVDGAFEGTSLARTSRVLFLTPAFSEVELELDLRVSAGASAEVLLHVSKGRATRVVFSPAGVVLHTGALTKGRTTWLGGSTPGLRGAFGAALAALVAGDDAADAVHAAARTLLDAGRLGSSVVPTEADPRRRASPGLRSLTLFALSTDGAATFRQHYYRRGGNDQREASGSGPAWLRSRESAWRTFLADRRFPDRVLQKERRRWGFDVLNGSFDRLDLRSASTKNKRKGGIKVGSGGGRWQRMRTGLRWRGPAWLDPKLTGRAYLRPNVRFGDRFCLRAQVALGQTSRVRAMLSTRSHQRSAIEVSTRGVGFFGPGGGPAFARVPHPLRGGRYLDIAFVFEAGGGRVYVDGELAAEVSKGLATGGGVAGVLVAGHDVRVREISYRRLN